MKAYFKKLLNNFKKSQLKVKILVIFSLLIYTLLLVFSLVKVNYEVITPGGLTPVSQYVDIESEEKVGNIYTVSVYSSKRISLIQKLIAGRNYQVALYEYDPATSLSNKDEIKQGTVMKDVSLINSLIVAYREAEKVNPNITFDYDFKGMVIHTTSNYTTKDLLIGDIITKINDEVVTLENYSDILSNIDKGDSCQTNPTPIKLEIFRNEKKQEITVYKSLDEDICKIGIVSYPFYEINKSIIPKYNIKNTRTIGPSGGLMQTLGIYNSLTTEDITKGLVIAGTGTIDVNGKVGPIGGVQQKIISAHFAKVDVFFVPEANYQEAKKIYDKLKKPTFELKMVRTFDEALDYLKNKEAK